MPKETLGYVRLEWTCPKCGAKNPGPQKLCTGCGAPQPEDVQFEQAAQEEFITDEEEIRRAKAGPDVHCFFCGARNPAGAKHCSQCGADLSKATARARGQVLGAHRDKPTEKVPCPFCDTPNPATALKCTKCGASLFQPKSEPGKPAAQAPKRGLSPWLFVAGGAIILLLLACFVLSILTKDVTGIVETVSWTRSIAIEELGPVTREDWRDEIPSDAVVGTCTQKLHHTQDEPDPNAKKVCGTTYTVDTGSGHGEVVQDCEYQVYADWCKYTAKEWKQVDAATLSGADLNPRWPDLQMIAGQREGAREETYRVFFDADGKDYIYQTSDAAEFAQCQIGSRWTLKVNKLNQVVSIKPTR